jgi:hypothetical protein
MKTLFAFLFIIVSAFSFIGFAEAGTFTDIIAFIKTNTPMRAGNIPWPALMILLATGIIGILGIRRKGKKF